MPKLSLPFSLRFSLPQKELKIDVSITQAALFGAGLGLGVAALKVFALSGATCFA